KNNICGETPVEFGDLEGTFANAAYVFEDVIETPIVTHSPIETHLSLVEPDPGSGRLTVYASNQSVFILRERIASALGRPIRDIRVIKGYVGGGFGGKQEPIYEIINCFAAQHCGRPVLLELTREESLSMTRTRHSDKIRIRSALDKDLHFIARDIELIANTGAYSGHGHNVALAQLSHSNALYPVPNFRFICKTVYTNIAVASAMRGYGGPQWHYAMESHVENICHRLGLDPYHFREINVCYPGGPFYTQFTGVNSSALPEMMAGGRADIGWDDFKKTEEGTVKRGIGMALASYVQSCYPHSVETSSARIIVHEDASATLVIGATEIGQGAETTFAQVAAEALGFPYEWIMMPKVIDTDVSPFDPGAYASRQTYVTGQAVKKAGLMCKNDILDFAAEEHNLDRDKIDIKQGNLINSEDESIICPIKEITWKLYYRHPVGAVCEHEAYAYPTDNTLTFAAAFAVVAVDTATGEVEVEKLRTYLDSGVIINPMAARGQLLGGAMMSYGYGLTEQLLINPKTGAIYNDNLLDYKVPRFADVPDLDGRFFESFEPSSAYGNKSMGEPPNLTPAVAIRNAVLDATGVPMNKFPLTPERVWEFLHPEEED
ncbi:MAG: molybdopterin-dependent oxidoreductase, partial [Lachnospiraceae bacterium]|nr:molybdopterin-dependent oxidoreductase [Candidatus Equihabitans merdae]